MKNSVPSCHLGLIVGGLLGGWHFLWAILVGLGWAKPLLDWIMGLHFIKMPFTMAPFEAATALTLIVVTFAFGYIIGWIFGELLNYCRRNS